MSGAQTSSFPDQNILYNAASGATLIANQRNQLLNTQTQQNISAADMEQMSRAANWISGQAEDQQPAAYQAALAQLRANGFAKNAPDQFPGVQAIKTFAAQGIPAEDQYKLGIVTPPGTTAAINAALGGGNPPAQGGQAQRPPAAPQDFSTALATTESGNKPGAINSAGYTGLYQFGKQRLQQLGYYTPAPGEDMSDNTTWAGKVSVPGFNVTDQKSFAANPAAQQAVFNTHVSNIDQAIDNTPGAANLDRNGLRAVAHLGGVAGMQRFVSSGGAYDPADSNGTRLSTYYNKFSGGAPAQPGSGAAVATTGKPPTSTSTATSAGGPVVVGDSLASPGGLGGSGVVGASPSAVRAQIAQGVQNGAYTGKDVVLSSGASNAPGDMENVEAQLKQLRDASSVTLLGVGPAVEAKNPGTNAALQKLAAQYGAKFQPLPADQMSPDGVHPNAAGYATLKTATAPPGAAPQGGRYQVASNAPVGPPSATAAAPAPAPGSPAGPTLVRNLDGSIGVAGGAPAAPVVAQGGQPPPSTPAAPGSAPPPAQPAQPAQPSGPQANLPHASEVPTGTNSPQYQQAMDLQRRAMLLDAQPDPTGRLKTLAAGLRSQAQLILQSDSVVNTQEGQLHTMTGKIDDPAKPLPHYVYDQTQHAYIDTTGTNKPEFQPAQRDTAVAQRDVMELGPKVANGTATPEEVAQYNVAATTYQQPTLRENPVTKETVRVNTRELPAGFPQPGAPGGAAPGAPGGTPGSNVVMPGLGTAQQQIERDPAAYKVAETQYDRDSKEIPAIGDAGRAAQADQIRIREMQDVLQRFSTGPGTEWRTAASAFLQRWLPSAVTGWEKEAPNLSGADAAQAFSKLALTGVGSQERSVLGNRGGYQAMAMFQRANPNIDLQDATNKSILDMQLISNQANQDYSQAALAHFADNERKFGTTHQYDSLAQFDRNWNAQKNPEVYAAAMGAIGGQPVGQWAKGLSEQEYQRAYDIAQRANPRATINARPPSGTVQGGFRYNGGDPADKANWTAVNG